MPSLRSPSLTCPHKPPHARPTCLRSPGSRSCQWTLENGQISCDWRAFFTYFEQLHSRHLVRSLTGSCTACGCLQEQSGLHMVTSKPFLSIKVEKINQSFFAWWQQYIVTMLNKDLPSGEKSLPYLLRSSKHVNKVRTLATLLKMSSRSSSEHSRNNHPWDIIIQTWIRVFLEMR